MCHVHRKEFPVPPPWEGAGVKEFLRLLLSQTAQVGKRDCIGSRREEGRGDRRKMTTERQL